jgi:adenylosuccinate lyase
MRAWEEERPFREVVAEDPELAGRLVLDAAFDPTAYTRHVDTVFDRLHTLVAEREGIHV